MIMSAVVSEPFLLRSVLVHTPSKEDAALKWLSMKNLTHAGSWLDNY